MSRTLSTSTLIPFEVTSFTLKLVAIVGMTLNHASYIFGEYLPFPVLCVFMGAGGLTFPIMAFLLVEGYQKTSDVKKYGLRLGIFALISQIPFFLFLDHKGNVLFTLLLGLILLYLYDTMKNRPLFWVVFIFGAGLSLNCDWGLIGIFMILMFKVLKGQQGEIVYPVSLAIVTLGLPTLMALVIGADIAYLPSVLYPLVGCSLTIPLMMAYHGQRGLRMKYFFYAYYPGHIALLGLLYFFLFGTMPLV